MTDLEQRLTDALERLANRVPLYEERANVEALILEGWEARRSDMTNHHRRVGDNQQSVVFFRHVHPETGVPIQNSSAEAGEKEK